MQITRMDLADKGSPEGIVMAILKAEPNLSIPVPIEELCCRLDIIEIQELTTAGFEGGLLTDRERSNGIILVKNGGSPQRRRFTLGHELGHFLMPSHVPDTQGHFLCSEKDMLLLDPKEGDRRAKMEVEANRFSSLILMPPPALRVELGKKSTPSLEHMLGLAKKFDVSKDAMARTYAEYHPETVAFVVVRDGKVVRNYRNKIRFPFITALRGRAVPERSLFYRKGLQVGVPSGVDTRLPDNWIDVERGRQAPRISEQVYLQANGFALIMLWYEPADDPDYDEDGERTAKERLKHRQSRFT
ncbi:Zn-dependent peptidase ImmA (M78 family) [Bradyrhizobium sp. GM5.1]